MMPERLANQDPFKPLTEVVGSGPFRFVADERVQGARNVYARFDRYQPRQDGKPDWTAGPKIVHYDRVVWTTMPDAGDRRRRATDRASRIGRKQRRTICCRC